VKCVAISADQTTRSGWSTAGREGQRSETANTGGRARHLCRLQLRDTLLWRRLGILVAHQHQDGTINLVLNDFEVCTSPRLDREATGIYCRGSRKCLASR
jgi:hypothetical protein